MPGPLQNLKKYISLMAEENVEHIIRRRHQEKCLYMYQRPTCPKPKYLNLLTWTKMCGENGDRGKLLVFQELLVWTAEAVPPMAQIQWTEKILF